jgi:hypothetical protein
MLSPADRVTGGLYDEELCLHVEYILCSTRVSRGGQCQAGTACALDRVASGIISLSSEGW